MSAPCSEKAKGPEPLGSSPFRWCEWGDLNSMGVVLCGQGDVESLCLLGFVMTDNHMVRVVFRVPVTNLLLAACPSALCGICPRAEREREKRGLAAAVGRRVTPKYSELTPK